MVGLDTRTLERLRDALVLLGAGRYSGDRWREVDRTMRRLERTLAEGDIPSARAIAADLEGEERRLSRAGERQAEEPRALMPEPVLLRRNKLVHELDLQLEALRPPDRGRPYQ